MPNYHFNTVDGGTDIDREGESFPNDDAARFEAIRYLGQMLADGPHHLSNGGEFQVEVVDDAGRAVCRIVTRDDAV